MNASTVQSVKQQKRRKTTRIVVAIIAILVTVFILVAFLSSYVGNFSIFIYNTNSKLAASIHKNMSESGTFLRTTGFTGGVDESITQINSILIDSPVDNDEETPTGEKSKYYSFGDSSKCYLYAMTFYISNYGDTTVRCNYGMNVLAETSDGDRKVSNSIRVRVYENYVNNDDGTSTHNFMDYTRKNTIPSSMSASERAYLEEYIDKYCENYKDALGNPLCTYFTDQGNNLFESTPILIEYGRVVRITYCMWIEGLDPDSVGEYLDGKLRVSFYVKAVGENPNQENTSEQTSSLTLNI